MNEYQEPEDDGARAVVTLLAEIAAVAKETPPRFTIADIKTAHSSRGPSPRQRRYRRPAWVWLTVIAMLAALLVLGFKQLPPAKPNGGPVSRPTPNGAATVPAEMVVWTSNFRIELISSSDGHVIRMLARDVALYRGTPRVTVSLSGTVYFDRAENVNGVPIEQIVSTPIAGGTVKVLAEGHDPEFESERTFSRVPDLHRFVECARRNCG